MDGVALIGKQNMSFSGLLHMDISMQYVSHHVLMIFTTDYLSWFFPLSLKHQEIAFLNPSLGVLEGTRLSYKRCKQIWSDFCKVGLECPGTSSASYMIGNKHICSHQYHELLQCWHTKLLGI
jgi:hypothetical protein